MKMDLFALSGGGLTPALLLYHLHPSFFRQGKLLSRDNRFEIKILKYSFTFFMPVPPREIYSNVNFLVPKP